MMCQNCNENHANIKYTQIINGVKKQMNLCDKCAKELGIDDISFDMQMDFSNFLGDIFEDFEESFIPSLVKPETLLCDKCKNSYDDFIKNGKFGCDKCYETFEDKIDSILKNIHGANKHGGRNIKQIETKENSNNKTKGNRNTKDVNKEENNINEKEIKMNKKIEELKERLKKEIKEERYEDAAKTRDEIKSLEK